MNFSFAWNRYKTAKNRKTKKKKKRKTRSRKKKKNRAKNQSIFIATVTTSKETNCSSLPNGSKYDQGNTRTVQSNEKKKKEKKKQHHLASLHSKNTLFCFLSKHKQNLSHTNLLEEEFFRLFFSH